MLGSREEGVKKNFSNLQMDFGEGRAIKNSNISGPQGGTALADGIGAVLGKSKLLKFSNPRENGLFKNLLSSREFLIE